MMPDLRRWLLGLTLALWQGGFVFYSAVVVPIGTDALGAVAQGRITATVAGHLNRAGLVFVVVAAWDVAVAGPRGRVWRIAILAGTAAGLALLEFLRAAMIGWLGPAGVELPRPFRLAHILYLWISTFHWLAALGFAWLSLRTWRIDDAIQPATASARPAR
jgi:hypothetical protein